jgi:phage gp45-like
VDNGHTVLSFASLNTTADLQNATTSVVEWTGGNIAAANLPQNAINGQLLYISGNGAQDITDDSAQTVAGFWGVSLVYSGGGWRIVGFLN